MRDDATVVADSLNARYMRARIARGEPVSQLARSLANATGQVLRSEIFRSSLRELHKIAPDLSGLICHASNLSKEKKKRRIKLKENPTERPSAKFLLRR